MQWRKLTTEERDQNCINKSSILNVPRVAKRFTDITTTTTHNNNYCYNKNNNKNTNKNNNDKKNNTAYLLREKKTSSLYCWEYTLQYLYRIHINKVHVKKLKCFEDGKNIPFNQGFFNLSSPEITNKITTFESFRLGEKEPSSQRNRLEQMIDS